MNELVKIKDISSKYDVTTRTLRYYEDVGLITSTRSNDYAYRMYDEHNIKRLEQILILRKLNISIKDIQRVFSTSGAEVVLEVLEKKVQNIDDEVALLHELKEIVLNFIREIERVNFNDNTGIKQLYEKAKEIESHMVSVDYIGRPNASKVDRLIEITDKLDKQIPDVMVVRIPPFRAVAGDIDRLMDWVWNDARKGYFKDIIFDCADFLIRYPNHDEYIIALNDHVTIENCVPFSVIDFPGGLYVMAMSINDDYDSIHKVEKKIYRWIETTGFEIELERGVMGNMAFMDDEIVKGLGYEQLQRYVPIKVKGSLSSA